MKIQLNRSYSIDTSNDDIIQILRCFYLSHPEYNLNSPSNEPYPDELVQLLSNQVGSVFDNSYASKNHYIADSLFQTFEVDCIAAFLHPNYLPATYHTHSFFEIIYVAQGECINYSGSQCLTLSEGDFMILAPGTTHTISLFDDTGIVINILMTTSAFEESFFKVFRNQESISKFYSKSLYDNEINTFLLFHTGQDIIIKENILNLYCEKESYRAYNIQMRLAYISVIFTRLFNRYEITAVHFNDNNQPENENLTLILRYMHNHYQTITLSSLAAFFGYSTRHISRLLKESTGNSYQETIQEIRMRQASRLLSEENLTIEQIGRIVGYDNPQNFRNIFKQYYGVSPSQYKKK